MENHAVHLSQYHRTGSIHKKNPMNCLTPQLKTIIREFTFYTGFALLFTHELDAVANHEWRVLPIVNTLPDEYGFSLFLILHIPLFSILIALVASTQKKIRVRSRIGISIFLVFHGVLHILFTGTHNYEFTSLLSNILIFGGALTGIIYLIMAYLEKRSYTR